MQGAQRAPACDQRAATTLALFIVTTIALRAWLGLIDDLLEIITTKKRAMLRTQRVTHRGGNVWSFLAAPNHIVNA